MSENPRPETRWLSIIGMGEDGPDGLTIAAKTALETATIVYGGQRHLSLAKECIAGEKRAWPSPIEAAFPSIVALKGQSVAVLASGDPFHFGVGSLLARHIPAHEMHVFAKPSSLALSAARLGWALQDCAIVSLHGRALHDLLPAIQNNARILALAWDETTASKVAALLDALGHGEAVLHLLERLDGPHEKVATRPASLCKETVTDPLCVIAVEILPVGGTIWPLTPGLDDSRFVHDGQITKQNIRAITLARLAPQAGQMLWDIGGGSGSIAIEWLLRHPANQAFSIERQGERVARIRQNAEALGAVRLSVVHGSAPDALQGLPNPDAVFIGGGTSNSAIIERAVSVLKTGGRCVANAVTIEGEQTLLHAAQRFGGEMNRISIDALDHVGPYRAWRASMPVAQWVFVKGAA
jgi:precorrin-6B C5,15-methyltransferase / cobalt-precorrin-6B C5,C15-methyltransferase